MKHLACEGETLQQSNSVFPPEEEGGGVLVPVKLAGKLREQTEVITAFEDSSGTKCSGRKVSEKMGVCDPTQGIG